MTKVDGWGNRYELAEDDGLHSLYAHKVPIRKNNATHVEYIPRDDWNDYKPVADSAVEQGELL